MRLLPSPNRRSTAAPAPTSSRIPGRTPAWQRRYRRHRRVLAALLAGTVVWGVVTAVRPAPAPTVSALIARRDLAPGAVLRDGDVVVEQRQASTLPVDSVAGPDALVGRTLSFPVRAGEPVTARHVVGAELLAALGPGLVATPVTLADPASAALVSRGDVVDVLAAASAGGSDGSTPTAAVVASRVRVLVAPVSAAAPSGGPLGSTGSTGAGAESRGSSALVLATTAEQALAIARAAVGSRLSLTIRGA